LAVFLIAAPGLQAALPEPPHQRDPWQAATAAGIPDYVLKAMPSLFQAGLADPRGGDYRVIEVRAWGNEQTQTHGWVFRNQFAVCWNGMVYPVLRIDAKADLEKDVADIAATQPWNWTPLGRQSPSTQGRFWSDMQFAGVSITPISMTLLVRLGRADLARRLWEVPQAGIREGDPPSLDHSSERDWLDRISWTWLATAFRRLVAERARDDDSAAVDTGESLIAWGAAGKHFARESEVAFLADVPALLTDSRRRSRAPVRTRADFQFGKHGKFEAKNAAATELLGKPQSERVAELIDRLEDVAAEKMSIPGNLVFMWEPICSLLAAEGDASVSPLIDVLEHDRRMTRTVDFTRPWYPAGRPIPVKEAATEILRSILQSPDLVDHSTPAELRAWWNQTRQKSPLERSFGILASDSASPQQWLDSAAVITQRSDMIVFNGSISIPEGACLPNRPAPPLVGEELRSRRNPSVSDLLLKRTASMAESSSSPDACKMAVMAYRWDAQVDAQAARPALQAVRDLETCRKDALVAAARVQIGDVQAAYEWAERSKAIVEGWPFFTKDLAALWLLPGNAAMERAAESLFTRPESPLSPRKRYDQIDTPLLAVPIYRKAVMAALQDTSIAGTATRSENGNFHISLANGGSIGGADGDPDPDQAKPGEERTVRVKDMVAYSLSRVEGFPKFKADWPAALKDRAISELENFLRVHDSDIKAFPDKLADTLCFTQKVYLAK
jgi:hypothetical protein